ncbi:hypothetical protein [Methanoculleus sp.]|jgi:hypothetical protein|uniref:hypothetical protein n=1 Tax=Methanoculleus sp. TaxID=90427 RepID=UPI0025F09CB6|nr:hypothetical protein [Methanoculleus sp.]
MKRKSLSGISALIVALLFVGAIFVPAVSADENNLDAVWSSEGNLVGKNVELARNPYLFDCMGNRLSDKEISQMIETMPAVTYLDGMDEEKSKEISERLSQLHKYRSVTMDNNVDVSLRSTQAQADSGIRINEHHYNGISGYNHPGNLEVSSSGTAYHYLTSHIGKELSGTPTWIEVGVTKQSPAVGGDPSEYVVFTYDSTAPEGEQYIAHQTFTSGSSDYGFEIYISTSQASEGYPYMLLWQGTVIRTGHVPFCFGDVDENHEYFALNGNSFTPVSEAYFCSSYLYTSYSSNTLWWNSNLQDSTVSHLVGCSAGTPELDFAVPWWSQAYQVRSWIV